MPPVDRNNPKRAKSSDSHYSLTEFQRDFPDDAACLEWLWRQRYSRDGKTALCPKCGEDRTFHRVKTRASYSCAHCGHHIHPTAGTIFHRSSTSLALWFYGIYLMANTRCGLSAKQLGRELGVNYRTAWRMLNLIRNHLMKEDNAAPLAGKVEVDETWVGGKMRESEKRAAAKRGIRVGPYAKPRPLVFGMVERGGRVRAMVVPERFGYTLRSKVSEHVLPDSIVFTDDYSGYSGLERRYRHRRIRHTARVYVEGDIHTQAIEGFFGLVKNGIRGTYHSVSAKHLDSYLAEFTYRYNRRHSDEPMFLSLIARAASA